MEDFFLTDDSSVISQSDSLAGTSADVVSSGSYNQQQVIKNFMTALSNSDLLTLKKSRFDGAVQLCAPFKTLDEAVEKMVADCQSAQSADDFLINYCGIILGNEDTGAAIGSDAGGSQTKTYEDLFPTSTSAVYPSATSFTKRGLTFIIPEKNSLSDREQLVIKGLYSWWADESLRLIEQTYGFKFDGQSVTINFYESPGAFASAYVDNKNEIWVNMASNEDLTEDNLKDYYDTFGQIFSHELTHVLQHLLETSDSHFPQYMLEGMAVLTAGGDLLRYSNIRNLAGNPSHLKSYLDFDAYNYEDLNVYAAGYMFFRYLMKQSSDSYNDGSGNFSFKNNSLIEGTYEDDNLLGSASNMTLTAGEGNDTVIFSGNNSTLSGNEDSDVVYFDSASNITYVYNEGDGNDILRGVYSKPLKINVTSGSYTSLNDGSNLMIRVGDNTITVEGSEKNVEIIGTENDGKNLPVFDTKYYYEGGNKIVSDYQTSRQINLMSDFTGIGFDGDTFQVNSSSGTLEIRNARGKFIKYGYGNVNSNVVAYSYLGNEGGVIDDRNFRSALGVMIGANYFDNQIYAGSGGSSMWGGMGGTDTLTGGNGYDEFFYVIGSGNDFIQNSASNDIINLLGVSLEQITGLSVDESAVNATFFDGGSLRIEGNGGVGYKLGDAVYTVNQSTGEWSLK